MNHYPFLFCVCKTAMKIGMGSVKAVLKHLIVIREVFVYFQTLQLSCFVLIVAQCLTCWFCLWVLFIYLFKGKIFKGKVYFKLKSISGVFFS